MSSNLKIIIIVLVVAGIAFFGYNYFGKTSTSTDVLVRESALDSSKIGAEVLVALNQLKTLKLDADVFKDKTFMSLVDYSKPLNAEPVGRVNPFSPIGIENGSVKLAPASTTTDIKAKATSTTTGVSR